MVLDPITQSALVLQRVAGDGLAAKAGKTVPLSHGHRVVEGFTMWVSQKSAPSLAAMADLLEGNGKDNVADGDTVTVGAKVYTFQTVLTNVDGNVFIGANISTSLKNLRFAINATGGVPGTDYAAAMTANVDVAASDSSGSVLVTQKTVSTGTVSVSTTSAVLVWATPTLVAANSVAGQLVHQTTSAPLLAGATTATFACALGYSLLPADLRGATKIMRIWADDELVYDASNPSAAPSFFNGMKMTFHEGDPNAEPDVTIAADMGALTPGFQNLMYVVFQDYPLQVGPLPTAPAPTVTQPVPVVTTKDFLFPGTGTPDDPITNYNGGLAWFGPALGVGHLWLKKPPNVAWPENGVNGYFLNYLNDGQSRTGHGGAYNSVLGTVTPYPVDIGDGTVVIAGNQDTDATVQSTTTEPSTTTNAPPPEPTYRTTLPKIRVELADAVVSAPLVTPFTLIDNTQTPNAGGQLADWDSGYLYAWSNTFGAVAADYSFVEHVYSFRDNLELVRYAPVDHFIVAPGTPEATYFPGANVHFTDTFTAHDKTNKLAFTQEWANAESNSDPIMMVDLTTGAEKGAYGNFSNSLGNVDFIGVGLQRSGDCVVSTDAGGTAYGLLMGQRFGGNVSLVQYNPSTGSMSWGGQHDLGGDGTGFAVVQSVLGYPLVDRADVKAKYGLSADSRQDWFAFAAVGTNIHLVQGQGQKIIGSTPVYTMDFQVQAMFLDPTDYNVVLFKTDGFGHYWLEKLQITTQLGVGGATPVFVRSMYSVPVPASFNLREISLRESRYTNGQMVYQTGWDWYTVDLSTGALLRTQTGNAFGFDFIYDAATGNAYAFASTAGPVALVQFTNGIGAAIKLSDHLTWLAKAAGYDDSEIVVSNIDDSVLGCVIDQKVVLWSLLQNLAKVYNFDFFESDEKIKFIRGTAGDATKAAYTIDVDTLTTAEGSEGDLKENVITTLAAPVEVANAVAVGYYDADFNFQPNTKTFQRARFPYRTVNPASTASYETYLVMTGSEALQRAAAAAFSSYAEGVVQNLKLPTSYARLEPSDAINLIINGDAFLVGLKELVYNNDWSISGTGVNFNYKNNVAIRADRPLGTPSTNNGPSDSIALAIDSSLPTAADDPGQAAALVITGVESLGQPWWNGAAFNMLTEGDTEWSRLYFTQAQTPYGTMAAALPATDTPFRLDEGGYDVISVSIGGGNKAGTLADLLAGTNAAYVGKPGRWELIYYESVTWANAKRFTFSQVLRGRRGTEVNCNNHQAGDYFVPFNRATMQMFPVPVAKLTHVMSYAAVGVGTTKAAPIETDVLEGNSLKPWAIRYVTATVLP